jgi:hypothetical protein
MTTFTRLPQTDVVELARNYMTNGSFEVGYGGWLASTNASSLVVVARPVAGDAALGLNALRWQATGAGDTQVRVGTELNVPTLPGEVVNASARLLLQAGTASRQGLVGFEFLDIFGALIGGAVLGPSESVDAAPFAERVVAHSAIAPAGTTATRIIVRVQSASAGQQVYLDGVAVTKGTVPASPYFDGATADAPPIEHRWTGPTYASESVQVQSTGLGGDELTPALIVKPYSSSRRIRTLAHQLAQSDDVRLTYVPAESAAGVMQLTYELEADAIAAVAYFGTAGEFLTSSPDIAGLPARFAVAGGDLRYELDDQVQLFHVYVPWKESFA